MLKSNSENDHLNFDYRWFFFYSVIIINNIQYKLMILKILWKFIYIYIYIYIYYRYGLYSKIFPFWPLSSIAICTMTKWTSTVFTWQSFRLLLINVSTILDMHYSPSWQPKRFVHSSILTTNLETAMLSNQGASFNAAKWMAKNASHAYLTIFATQSQ